MRTYVICGKRKIFWIPTAIFGVGTLLYKFISYYLTLNHVQCKFWAWPITHRREPTSYYSRLDIILPPFNGCLADLLPSAASMSVVFLVAYDAGDWDKLSAGFQLIQWTAMTLFIGWVAFGKYGKWDPLQFWPSDDITLGMWRTDDRVWNHVFKVLYGEGEYPGNVICFSWLILQSKGYSFIPIC